MPDRAVTPASVLSLSLDQLRSVGLSRQKMSYLVDLSQRVLSEQVALATLDDMADEQVI